MDTLGGILTEYWWIIPVGLLALCIFTCILGRKACSRGCPCWGAWREGTEPPPPAE